MKGLKKTRRIQVIIASAVLLALATGLIGFALKDGINLFRAPARSWQIHHPRMKCFGWEVW